MPSRCSRPRRGQGLEVDFLVPGRGRKLTLIEAKATRTVRPEAAESLNRLRNSISGYSVDAIFVHLQAKTGPKVSNVRPGVRAATCSGIAEIVHE